MADDEQLTRPLPDGPPGELPVGAELNNGQYKIVRNIAAGGFGITYLAQDNLNRDVALKECFPLGLVARSTSRAVSAASESTAESFSTARNLFLREARLLAQLSHPNVVHVQTLFEENGTAYMAMDFIHGNDLQEVINTRSETLTPASVLDLARNLLSGLSYLHESGLLHRDIKPSNIRIDQFGRPILIDFGAARQQTRAETRKMGTFRVVSDGYSPSEFYTTGAEQSPASDLYSLAATLYHAIAGEAPPAADVRIQKIATSEPDPYEGLAARFPDHDQALLTLIDRSMAVSMKERPQSAKDWLTKLDASVTRPLLADAVATPPPLVSPPTASAGSAATQPVSANGGTMRGALFGGGGVAVLAGLAFALLGGGSDGMSSQEADALQAQLNTATQTISGLRTEALTATNTINGLEAQLDTALQDLETAQRESERAVANAGPVPEGCPDFDARAPRSVALTGTFLQSSAPTYTFTAGGTTDITRCPHIPGRGSFEESASIRFLLSDMASETGRIEFRVTSACDTTMLVNTPTAIWYFDDDSNGSLQPRVVIPNLEAFNSNEGGPLDVWLGTFDGTESCNATLEVQGFQ